MQVFEVYARERRPLTNSEMARHLELADSSCSNLRYTLRQAGYLLRTPKSRNFHPTSRLLDIAPAKTGVDPLRMFAGESLELLTARSDETSICAHLDGNAVKIFDSQESSRALRYVLLEFITLTDEWAHRRLLLGIRDLDALTLPARLLLAHLRATG